MENRNEYEKILIAAIHQCAIRFAEFAESVVLILLDFVAGPSGADVMLCVKPIIEQYPAFRSAVVRKILDNMDEISSPDALCEALWILAEYSHLPCPNVSFISLIFSMTFHVFGA